MRRRIRTHRGFTLVELVVSMSILAALLLATQSALVLTRELGSTSKLTGTADAVSAMDQLAAHAAVALSLSVGSSVTLSLTVADITGDAADDKLDYAWDGKQGSPLTLSINGGKRQPVIGAVESLTFSAVTKDLVIPVAPDPSSPLPPAEFSLRPCTTTTKTISVVNALSASVYVTGDARPIVLYVRTLNLPGVK